ncbi:MAG: PHP domain-containing protein [Candidatus Margulisiibacteriota bacterium]
MKYIADLHVHTISSGHAYNTIYEYAEQAKKKGLKYIAMTDHGPAMGGAPHEYHFANLHSLPKKIMGVRILKGIEANIINADGQMDLQEQYLKELEVVIASFHMFIGYEGSDERVNTETLLKVIKNPYVKIIGHAGNPQFKIDIPAVVEACEKHGVLLEINNSSFSEIIRQGSYDRCVEIARQVKKIGWKVCFGSDSHCIDSLGVFTKSEEVARKAGLEATDIVNTSGEMVEKYVLRS